MWAGNLPAGHAVFTSTLAYALGDELSLRLANAGHKPKCLIAEETVTLVAGTHTYTLTTNFMAIEGVTIDGYPLKKSTARAMSRVSPKWDSDPSVQVVSYIEAGITSTGGRKIRFIPTPNSAGSAIVRGFKKPTAWATVGYSTAIVDIPEDYHGGLAAGIAFEYGAMPSSAVPSEKLQLAAAKWGATRQEFLDEQCEELQDDLEPEEWPDAFTQEVDTFWRNY